MLSKFLSIINYPIIIRNIRYSSTFTLLKDNDAVKKYNKQQKNNNNNIHFQEKYIQFKKIEMHESHSSKPFILYNEIWDNKIKKK